MPLQIPQRMKKLLNRTPFKRRITVKRDAQSYITELGWELTSGSNPGWQGYYRSRYGSYLGYIIPSTPPKFYIHNPPQELRGHSHWTCFQPVNDGWYFVHFYRVPKEWDSAILKIEGIINESFTLAKKSA